MTNYLELFKKEYPQFFLTILVLALILIFSNKFLGNSKERNSKKISYIALFSAISFILMFIGFPILPVAPYLKIDFSVLVILILALRIDYKSAVAASLITNLLHYIFMGSATGLPVDQIANFIATVSFIVPVLIFGKKKQDILGLLIGVFTVAFVMVMLNVFWITPFYFNLAGWPLPENLFYYCLGIYGPFNLIKWGLVAIAFYIVKRNPRISNF